MMERHLQTGWRLKQQPNAPIGLASVHQGSIPWKVDGLQSMNFFGPDNVNGCDGPPAAAL